MASVTESLSYWDAKVFKSLTVRNASSNKCLGYVAYVAGERTLQLVTCNQTDKDQQFDFFAGNGQQIVLRDSCATTWHQNDVFGSGDFVNVGMLPCNHAWGRNHSMTYNVVNPYKDSPFKIVNTADNNRAWFDESGIIQNRSINTEDDRFLWVPELLAQDCQAANITMKKCSIENLCAINPSAQWCKAYCENDITRKSKCDVNADKWCKEHPNDREFCGCINVDKSNAPPGVNLADWAKITARPECFLQSCTTNDKAYRTTEQRKSPQCSSMTICVAQIQAGVSANLSNVQFNQNCSSHEEKNETKVTVNNYHAPAGTTTTPPPSSNKTLYIVLGVVGGMFVLLVIFFLLMRS